MVTHLLKQLNSEMPPCKTEFGNAIATMPLLGYRFITDLVPKYFFAIANLENRLTFVIIHLKMQNTSKNASQLF